MELRRGNYPPEIAGIRAHCLRWYMILPVIERGGQFEDNQEEGQQISGAEPNGNRFRLSDPHLNEGTWTLRISKRKFVAALL